jgi:25S rRNA (cytosine2278-C5)-methyltransferase
LASPVANERGWRLLRRDEQVSGLRKWQHRGVSRLGLSESEPPGNCAPLSEEQLEACIRCHAGDAERTMGFFVCCFVRSPSQQNEVDDARSLDDDGWEGFSD